MSKTSKTQDDATKYILRHDLERQMSRLMNALLKEHPEDPKQFLVEYLSTKMTKRQIEEAGLCYIKEKEEEVIKEQEHDENDGVLLVDNMSPTAAAAATREDGTQTETNNEEVKANYEENGKLGNENELHTNAATDDMGAPKTADISASAHDITEEEGVRDSGIEEGGAPKEERERGIEEETAGEESRNADAQAGETAADTDAGVAMEGAAETAADTDLAAAVIADGAAPAESDAQAQDAESLDPPLRGTEDAAAADIAGEDANGAIIETSATTATNDGVSASVPVEHAPAEVPPAPAENEEAFPPHEEEAGTKVVVDAGEAAPVSAAAEDDKARDTPPEAAAAAAPVELAQQPEAAAPGVDEASLADSTLIEGRPLQEDAVGEQAAAQDTAEEKGEAL